MTRVTGKFQVTLPKRLVDAYGIRVGDEVQIVAAGETLSIVPANALQSPVGPRERLRLFDEATKRHPGSKRKQASSPTDRGWTREELYVRGRPR